VRPSRIVAGLLACAVTASVFALPTLGHGFREMAIVRVFWVFVVDAQASAR
jgi:hypothetical protein